MRLKRGLLFLFFVLCSVFVFAAVKTQFSDIVIPQGYACNQGANIYWYSENIGSWKHSFYMSDNFLVATNTQDECKNMASSSRLYAADNARAEYCEDCLVWCSSASCSNSDFASFSYGGFDKFIYFDDSYRAVFDYYNYRKPVLNASLQSFDNIDLFSGLETIIIQEGNVCAEEANVSFNNLTNSVSTIHTFKVSDSNDCGDIREKQGFSFDKSYSLPLKSVCSDYKFFVSDRFGTDWPTIGEKELVFDENDNSYSWKWSGSSNSFELVLNLNSKDFLESINVDLFDESSGSGALSWNLICVPEGDSSLQGCDFYNGDWIDYIDSNYVGDGCCGDDGTDDVGYYGGAYCGLGSDGNYRWVTCEDGCSDGPEVTDVFSLNGLDGCCGDDPIGDYAFVDSSNRYFCSRDYDANNEKILYDVLALGVGGMLQRQVRLIKYTR